MICTREYYHRMAVFSWQRAHKATNREWRARWFYAFEVFTMFRDTTKA